MKKKLYAVAMALTAGTLSLALGVLVGEWYEGVLRHTGGVITAHQLIECRYVIPGIFAIVAAYLTYQLLSE